MYHSRRIDRWPCHRTFRQTRTSCGDPKTTFKAGELTVHTLFDMSEQRDERDKWTRCSENVARDFCSVEQSMTISCLYGDGMVLIVSFVSPHVLELFFSTLE